MTTLAVIDLIALLAIVVYLLWLRRPKGPPRSGSSSAPARVST